MNKHGDRVLIIGMDLLDTAPGIVFKTLIKNMASKAILTVLSPVIDPELLPYAKGTISVPYCFHGWKKDKFWWRLLGFNIYDRKWTKKTMRKHGNKLCGNKFDIIISFTSNGYYASMDLGREVKRHNPDADWVIYSVDGLPSPPGWFDDANFLRKKIISHIREVASSASVFFSSNELMMDYQRKLLPAFRGEWSYLYTPYRLFNNGLELKKHEGFNIVYAGALYGLRKIDSLLEAFRQFHENRNDARLYFIGDTVAEYKEKVSDEIKDAVIFKPFTRDIDSCLATADILLDIASCLPDDVFLSSKIISYLPINLPIVAISGPRSAASVILHGVDSIAHCGDSVQAILEAFRRFETGCDTSDRKELLVEFSAENIAEKFLSEIGLI